MATEEKKTIAIERNPTLSKNRAKQCDSNMHEYGWFELSSGKTMACIHCYVRKGGLTSLVVKQPLSQGKSTSKGSLTAKKSE